MAEHLLPDEPPGWRELCSKIQQEKDSDRLAELVRQVNALLAEHERAVHVD